jgi:hypothetical protein
MAALRRHALRIRTPVLRSNGITIKYLFTLGTYPAIMSRGHWGFELFASGALLDGTGQKSLAPASKNRVQSCVARSRTGMPAYPPTRDPYSYSIVQHRFLLIFPALSHLRFAVPKYAVEREGTSKLTSQSRKARAAC